MLKKGIVIFAKGVKQELVQNTGSEERMTNLSRFREQLEKKK